jgi:hypothetical protein
MHSNTHAVDIFINNYMIWISLLIKHKASFFQTILDDGKINFYFP